MSTLTAQSTFSWQLTQEELECIQYCLELVNLDYTLLPERLDSLESLLKVLEKTNGKLPYPKSDWWS